MVNESDKVRCKQMVQEYKYTGNIRRIEYIAATKIFFCVV